MRLPTQSEPAARDRRRHPRRGLNPEQIGVLPHDAEEEYDGEEGDESEEYGVTGEYDQSGEYSGAGEYDESGE